MEQKTEIYLINRIEQLEQENKELKQRLANSISRDTPMATLYKGKTIEELSKELDELKSSIDVTIRAYIKYCNKMQREPQLSDFASSVRSKIGTQKKRLLANDYLEEKQV